MLGHTPTSSLSLSLFPSRKNKSIGNPRTYLEPNSENLKEWGGNQRSCILYAGSLLVLCFIDRLYIDPEEDREFGGTLPPQGEIFFFLFIIK